MTAPASRLGSRPGVLEPHSVEVCRERLDALLVELVGRHRAPGEARRLIDIWLEELWRALTVARVPELAHEMQGDVGRERAAVAERAGPGRCPDCRTPARYGHAPGCQLRGAVVQRLH